MLKDMALVGGTVPGQYQGQLEVVQCDCCRGHSLWWHEGMERICGYCLNREG